MIIFSIDFQKKKKISSYLEDLQKKNTFHLLPNPPYYLNLRMLNILKITSINNSVILSQSVNSIIRFAHSSQISANGVSDIVAGNSTSFVNVGDVDLNGGVVFDSDESAGGGAFSWVEFHLWLVLVVFLGFF